MNRLRCRRRIPLVRNGLRRANGQRVYELQTLDAVLDRISSALTRDGHVVVCHWRHPVTDYLQTGDEVHERLAAHADRVGWHRLVRHDEEDFLLEVFSPDRRSVAAETGLL